MVSFILVHTIVGLFFAIMYPYWKLKHISTKSFVYYITTIELFFTQTFWAQAHKIQIILVLIISYAFQKIEGNAPKIVKNWGRLDSGEASAYGPCMYSFFHIFSV